MSILQKIQLTLEQHEVELPRSTHTRFFFFNKYIQSCKCNFFLPYDFNNIFFSLAYFILRVQYIICTTYKNMLIDYVIGKASGRQ